MSYLFQRELAKWQKNPMIPGKLYESLALRELLNFEDLIHFYDLDHCSYSLIALIEKNKNVVYLNNVVLEFDLKENGVIRQNFIKVLTEDGSCGWIIWFPGDWKRII